MLGIKSLSQNNKLQLNRNCIIPMQTFTVTIYFAYEENKV